MSRQEWEDFIEENKKLFFNVFTDKATAKKQFEAKKELVYLVRSRFGYNDRDDAFVINQCLAQWQLFKGASV